MEEISAKPQYPHLVKLTAAAYFGFGSVDAQVYKFNFSFFDVDWKLDLQLEVAQLRAKRIVFVATIHLLFLVDRYAD